VAGYYCEYGFCLAGSAAAGLGDSVNSVTYIGNNIILMNCLSLPYGVDLGQFLNYSIMKKLFLLLTTGLAFLCTQVSGQQHITGQQINTDSLKLISSISDHRLKLAKLQNMIDQKTQNKADAAEKAQMSANDNATAANNLSENPQDKQLAKNAANKADDAKSDAKKGRKESARLDKLHKDIRDLKSKIADEEVKLSQYTPVVAAVPVVVPAPVDSTQHR
jgi:hypothetical protein